MCFQFLWTVLARVQDFLPRLKAENDTLVQRIRDNPSSADIENIEEGTDQYIEMASPFHFSRARRKKKLKFICRVLGWAC